MSVCPKTHPRIISSFKKKKKKQRSECVVLKFTVRSSGNTALPHSFGLQLAFISLTARPETEWVTPCDPILPWWQPTKSTVRCNKEATKLPGRAFVVYTSSLSVHRETFVIEKCKKWSVNWWWFLFCDMLNMNLLSSATLYLCWQI